MTGKRVKRVDGQAFCFRCEKNVDYHISRTELYGITAAEDKICNECDYAILRPMQPSKEAQP